MYQIATEHRICCGSNTVTHRMIGHTRLSCHLQQRPPPCARKNKLCHDMRCAHENSILKPSQIWRACVRERAQPAAVIIPINRRRRGRGRRSAPGLTDMADLCRGVMSWLSILYRHRTFSVPTVPVGNNFSLRVSCARTNSCRHTCAVWAFHGVEPHILHISPLPRHRDPSIEWSVGVIVQVVVTIGEFCNSAKSAWCWSVSLL